ncbi:DUF6680 family protein, partial [Bradyrhizobium sp. Leo170]|uniref:DUF6680 family protein n=1 Tax=Bradyrhizobium sp. Leo170 TaxID=1571199 RepID=UPI00102EC50D
MSVEWWVVFATLVGPVLAVQTQKFIERAGDHRARRQRIFVALMANRATRLADDFVKALNLIDLEYLPSGWSRRKDKAVIDAWHALLDDLNHGPGADADKPTTIAWNARCDDRIVELLAAMSSALGYSFTREQLRRGIYHPQGVYEREQAQLAILDGLRKVLTGQGALPMAVTQFPANPDFAAAQLELNHSSSGSATISRSGEVRLRGGNGDWACCVMTYKPEARPNMDRRKFIKRASGLIIAGPCVIRPSAAAAPPPSDITIPMSLSDARFAGNVPGPGGPFSSGTQANKDWIDSPNYRNGDACFAIQSSGSLVSNFVQCRIDWREGPRQNGGGITNMDQCFFKNPTPASR